jgi:hypothetical protein
MRRSSIGTPAPAGSEHATKARLSSCRHFSSGGALDQELQPERDARNRGCNPEAIEEHTQREACPRYAGIRAASKAGFSDSHPRCPLAFGNRYAQVWRRAKGGGRGKKPVAHGDLSWAATVFQNFPDFFRLQLFGNVYAFGSTSKDVPGDKALKRSSRVPSVPKSKTACPAGATPIRSSARTRFP